MKKHKDVWKVKKLNSTKEFYIVHKDGKYAHGNSIREAKESLIYKITSRDKSKYENLNGNSKLKLGEMIECYRVITGACEFGVKDFINNVLNGKPKKEYTINEIITITKNHYGHKEFKDFFKV